MKFVLVNGRTPYPQTFCMLCCESIKSSYLRATVNRHWNGTPYRHPKGTPLIGVFCW